MGRCEQLEEILEARYDLECASRETRLRCEVRMWKLVDRVRQATNATREEFMVAIFPRYLEYRKKQREEERLKGARNLR